MNTRPSILIVDDEELNRDILEEMLSDEYVIYQASNGRKAIEFLASGTKYIQLILLDINMPEMNGFEVLKTLKRMDTAKDIPVIIISSDSALDTVTQAYNLGAVDYFGKPFVMEIVRKCVSNTIHLSQKEYTDSLTGGYNRKGFERGMDAFFLSVPKKDDYAIIYFDIKNYKGLSELFKGRTGKSLIMDFYDRLTQMNPLVVSRLELDHFAMIVKNDKEEIEKNLSQMSYLWKFGEKTVRVYYQAGIYVPSGESLNTEAMIERARMACESIVDEYTNSYAYFNDDIYKNYVNQADVISRFDEAIANREFLVYYQPVVDPSTNKIVSAEALVRWMGKQGLVPPGIFIPVLEKDGYISELDNYVIETVYQDLEDRMMKGERIVPISINLSWMDFYDNHIQETIRRLIESKPLITQYIRYEVTETSIAALSKSSTREILHFIKDNAVKLLIDDFGSGYSSFSILDKYKFDILKIDMSLTRQITTNRNMQAIILCIIRMCHEIGIKVLAEGAEIDEEVGFLRDNSCDYIQGYYYSKPLPKKEFLDYLEAHH